MDDFYLGDMPFSAAEDEVTVRGYYQDPWVVSIHPDDLIEVNDGSWLADQMDFFGDGGGGAADAIDPSTEPNSDGEFEDTENAGEFKYSSEKDARDAAKAALAKLISANPGIEIRIDVYKDSNGNYGFTNAYTDFRANSVDGKSAVEVGLYGTSEFSGTLHNHPGHNINNFDVSYSGADNQLAATGANVYVVDSQGEMYQLADIGGGQYVYRKVSS